MKRQVWQFLRLFHTEQVLIFSFLFLTNINRRCCFSKAVEVKIFTIWNKKEAKVAFLQSRHLNDLLLVKSSVGRQVYQKAKSVFKKKISWKDFKILLRISKRKLVWVGHCGGDTRHTEYFFFFYASIALVSTIPYSVLNAAYYCLTFKYITKIHSLQLLIL